MLHKLLTWFPQKLAELVRRRVFAIIHLYVVIPKRWRSDSRNMEWTCRRRYNTSRKWYLCSRCLVINQAHFTHKRWIFEGGWAKTTFPNKLSAIEIRHTFFDPFRINMLLTCSRSGVCGRSIQRVLFGATCILYVGIGKYGLNNVRV